MQSLRPQLHKLGITRVANITGLDQLGLPVVMVSRPNSRSLAVSQGKGLTLAAAKVSGIMEAIETQHAETVHHSLKLASLNELRDQVEIIEIDRMARSTENRFHGDLPLLWIEGEDLSSTRKVWLPFEAVHTNYTLPRPPGSGCFPANTNGLASGNHLLEAICHAICELIERDAITLWLRASAEHKHNTGIDLSSIGDERCGQVLAAFEAANLETRIWDVTTDTGVACFYCLVANPDNNDVDPEFGGGCHPDRNVALLRAMTEAAQARTTFIAGSRDDFGPDAYAHAARDARRAACSSLLRPGPASAHFERTPHRTFGDFDEDLTWLLERLKAISCQQVVVVDLSKPEFNIPVVRAVIPGLEGAYKGPGSDYVPGPRATRQSSRIRA